MPATPPPPPVPFWKQPSIYVTLLLVPLVYIVVLIVLLGNFSVEMKAMVITAIMGSALTAIIGFWFAGSTGERKKDEALVASATNNLPAPPPDSGTTQGATKP